MLDVLDALLELADPGGTVDATTSLRTSTSGAVVDHTGARPFEVDLVENRWYGWLLEDRHVNDETGPASRENFAFTLLYVLAAGEQARQLRSREVSVAMDAKAHAFLDRLAAGQGGPPWLDAVGAIDQAAITGFSVRGIGLRINGYRYRG